MYADRRYTLWPRGLFALLLLTLTSLAHAARIDIQHWETTNGARVYFVPAMELPIVDIQLVFDAGSAHDGSHAGLAQLTSRMLAEGAGDMGADAIAERFEGLGAQFGADAQRDMAVLTLRSLSDASYLDPALDTLATIVRAPTFAAQPFERERSRLLIDLQSAEQSPSDIAEDAFYRAVYGQHPYASPVLGSTESVQALTRDDLANFHREYYVARNAVVAIVGALSRAQAEQIVERALGSLPEGATATPVAEVSGARQAERIRIEFPSSQTHVLVGQPGISRLDPDYFPLYVGNYVLGGSGLVARVSEEVREKRGLAYSAYSYFTPMRAQGPFTLGLQTRNDQAEQALTVLFDTLNHFIAEGPTAAELIAAKKNITGSFPLRIASNQNIVGNLAVIGFYGLPLDYLDTFNSRVEAVNGDQIRNAFHRRIDPATMVTVTVGQSAK
ncbi:MAG: insulinase family protein [Chromatiales bacterium]|jgi:zinc protease|nr:insulinase family protein [Chromatiales bacterium]